MAPVAVEPLVLLANPDKWLTESLESVLTQGGYRVLATPKRQQVRPPYAKTAPTLAVVPAGDARAFTLGGANLARPK